MAAGNSPSAPPTIRHPRSAAQIVLAAIQAEATLSGAPLSPSELRGLSSTAESETPEEVDEPRCARLLRAAYQRAAGPEREHLDGAIQRVARTDSYLAIIIELADLRRRPRRSWQELVRLLLTAILAIPFLMGLVWVIRTLGGESREAQIGVAWLFAVAAAALYYLAWFVLGKERLDKLLDTVSNFLLPGGEDR